MPIDPVTGQPTELITTPTQVDPTASLDFTDDDGAVLSALAATPDDPNEISLNHELDRGQAATETGGTTMSMEGGPNATQPPTPLQVDGEVAPLEISPGQKGSVSYRGVTAAGLRRSGGVFDKEAAKAEATNQEYDLQLADQKARMQADMERKKAALDEEAAFSSDYLTRVADIHKQQDEFNLAQMQLEQMAASVAKQEAAEYIGAYKQEMAGVRQMMLQTGNPLGGLDTTGGLAMMGALFAQGFLGARYGVQINVSGQIDNWVQREMEHHQQSIRNRTDAAKANLTLYDIARQGAKDDWEARSRLRGFVIDGVKSRLLMEANRYGSQTAMSDAKAKAAELDSLQTSNEIMLEEKVRKEKQDNLKSASDMAAQRAAAGTASARLQLDRDALQFQKDRAAKEDLAKVVEAPQGIADPTTATVDADGNETDGGQVMWDFDTSPVISDTMRTAAAKKVSESQEGYEVVNNGLKKLRELYKEAEPFMKGPDIYRRLKSEEYRRYEAQRNQITANIMRGFTGLAATDAERKMWQDQLKADSMFQEGSNMGLIDQLNTSMREKHKAGMNSLLGVGLKAVSDPNRRSARRPNPDASGQGRDAINLSNEAQSQTAVGRDISALRPTGPKEIDTSGSMYDIASSAKEATKPQAGATMSEPTKAWGALMGDTPQPAETKIIDDIARGVLFPSTYRQARQGAGDLPKSDAILRQQLMAALKNTAERDLGRNTGDFIADPVKQYAAAVYAKLHENDKAMAKLDSSYRPGSAQLADLLGRPAAQDQEDE